MTQIRAFKFLVRQCLPLRGRIEESSNLQQLLKCLGEEKWIEHAHCLSPLVVNAQIDIMAGNVLRDLMQDFKKIETFCDTC